MVMDQITQLVSTILEFLSPLIPIISPIILYVIPIYIQIGGFFAAIGNFILSLIPEGTNIVSYILLGIFIVLGLIGGIYGKTKEEKQEIANNQGESAYIPDTAENSYDF